jgi:predicted RNA binding protein YcfA (HicA-like mRNA interferase family)
VTGKELVKSLAKLGYQSTRPTGSPVRMTVKKPREGHVTIPMGKPIPAGTLSAILKEAAAQLEIGMDELLERIA